MTNRNKKAALIIGASRSIGAAAARVLAEGGAEIVINYRSKGPKVIVRTYFWSGRPMAFYFLASVVSHIL